MCREIVPVRKEALEVPRRVQVVAFPQRLCRSSMVLAQLPVREVEKGLRLRRRGEAVLVLSGWVSPVWEPEEDPESVSLLKPEAALVRWSEDRIEVVVDEIRVSTEQSGGLRSLSRLRRQVSASVADRSVWSG